MSKTLKAQRTPLSCALLSATAIIGMTFAMQASAFSQIPLSLDDAQAVADADHQSSISVGAQHTHVNGDGPAVAKAWNGYESAKTAADVDVNLQGGEGTTQWSVQGTDLGTPIPEVTGKYGVASKWDVDARYKRFRHVSTEIDTIPMSVLRTTYTDGVDMSSVLEHNVLEQVRDVYAVNGRLFVLPQLTVTAGYQLDHRTGDLSMSGGTDGGVASLTELKYGIRDNHHQAKAGAEYVGSNWTMSAEYYLSKYENDSEDFIRTFTMGYAAPGYTSSLAKSLDPSNTLHRIALNGTYQVARSTTIGMRAAYTWNELDSDVYQYNALPLKALGIDASVKMPEFAIGVTSRPIDPLSLKLDYTFTKMDKDVSGVEAWNVGQTERNQQHPYDGSYSESKVKGSATYSFGHGYSARLHGKYQQRDYSADTYEKATYTTVDTVKSYAVGLELRKRMSAAISGSVGYTYQGRSTNGWHLDHESPTYEWNWLDYDQHSVDFRLITNPTDQVTLSFLGSIYKRTYKDVDVTPFTKTTAAQGTQTATNENAMQDAKGLLFGVDLDWAPTRDWNVFAFYNYDRMTSNAHSNWLYTPYGSPNTYHTIWDSDGKSQSHTFGLGFGVHPVNQPWKVSFRYVYGYDSDKYVIGDEVKNHVRTQYATANFDYKLNKSWTLMGATMYGHGSSYDFHRSGDEYTAGDTSIDLINSPNYNAFAVFVGAKYYLP